ncbi:MAG: T9SS type A sorting domain-containing protein [Bacteroidia bacterium]
MKNIYISLIVLLTFNHLLKAQSYDLNSFPAKMQVAGNKSANTISISKNIYSWGNVRALNEVNSDSIGEAYPYISADGLRLYFSQGSNGLSNLYYVSRNNTSQNFSNKQLLSSNFPYNSLSCYLTNDELEIYFIKSSYLNDSLFYSSRSSISSVFAIPVSVSLQGSNHGFYKGPSLTPNKQELYLLYKFDTNQYILKFNKTANNIYTLNDTIDIPYGYQAEPGQLSKDGLKYYISLNIINDTITKIYQLSRTSLNTAFTNLSELNNCINDTNFTYNSQPSISINEKIFVWVKNNNGMWDGNDLYIANDTIVSSSKSFNANTITIQPNFVSTFLTINIPIQIDIQNTIIYIYNMQGQLILQQLLYKAQNEINISRFAKGLYIVKIYNDKNSIISKFVKE